MARRKSSHRSRRTKHTRGRTKRSRRTKHTRRVRRTRRGGDGSIGTPYTGGRIMPLNPNQTLDGRYFSRANQIGGGLINQNNPNSGGIGRQSGGLIGGNPAGGGVGPTRQSGGGVGHYYTGRSQCEEGILQPSGSMMKVGGADGYMKTCLNTGGRG